MGKGLFCAALRNCCSLQSESCRCRCGGPRRKIEMPYEVTGQDGKKVGTAVGRILGYDKFFCCCCCPLSGMKVEST